MIKDKFHNIVLYENLSVNLKKAIQCIIQKSFLKDLEATGRIDGEGYYVMLQKYDTKPENEGKWETHKRYIDIQYIVSGVEMIKYTNLLNLEELIESDEKRDFYFYRNAFCEDSMIVREGEFVIFFPEDGHKPSLHVDEELMEVRKMVAKVRV